MIKKEVSMNKLTLEVGEEREVNFHLSYGLLSLIFARLISTHIRIFKWHFCIDRCQKVETYLLTGTLVDGKTL